MIDNPVESHMLQTLIIYSLLTRDHWACWRACDLYDQILGGGYVEKREGKCLYIIDLLRSKASKCCRGCRITVFGDAYHYTVPKVWWEVIWGSTFRFLDSIGAHVHRCRSMHERFLKVSDTPGLHLVVNLKSGLVQDWKHSISLFNTNFFGPKLNSLWLSSI